MPKTIEIESTQKRDLLVDALEDRKAEDIVVLDLRDKEVLLADFFIVCTGRSVPHIRAIAERALERMKDELHQRPNIEGEAVAEWVLIDCGDVVVHIMDEASRERYKLEQFWSTPQPKGALPPRPGDAMQPTESDLEDLAFEGDTFDDEDEKFFADADTEVEPIDEDELD
jgi:ribosome-associated protein